MSGKVPKRVLTERTRRLKRRQSYSKWCKNE